MAVSRHAVLTDWETYAAAREEAFGEPIIIDHLEQAAEVPGAFESVFGNIRRLLDAAPWLHEDDGYDWALDRNAYRFAAEALAQWRVLNAVAGLVPEDVARGSLMHGRLAARQSLAWQRERAEPRCVSHAGWHFVVLPFGWDNISTLMLTALRAHPARVRCSKRS